MVEKKFTSLYLDLISVHVFYILIYSELLFVFSYVCACLNKLGCIILVYFVWFCGCFLFLIMFSNLRKTGLEGCLHTDIVFPRTRLWESLDDGQL